MLLPLIVCLAQDAAAPAPPPPVPFEVLREYRTTHLEADAALVAGRLDEARAGFERCLEYHPEGAAVAYALACVEARAGRTGRALEHLERAQLWGHVDDAVARWDPDLAALRGEPRFGQVLARMAARRGEVQGDRLGHERLSFPNRHSGHAAISPTGDVVVLGDSWGYVHVLDARTGAVRRVIDGFDRPIGAMDVSPDGTRVAALAYDGSVGSWRLSDGRRLFEMPVLPAREDQGWGFGSTLHFDPTGQRLFVAVADKGGAILGSMGALVQRWTRPLGGFFGISAAWNADGSLLATFQGSEVHLHSGDDGALVRRIETGVRVASVAFDPSDGDLATGHVDGRARVWDMPSGDLRWQYMVEDVFLSTPRVPTLAFSPDGARLAVTSVASCNVWVVDATTGKSTWHSGFLGGRMGEPIDVSWSDGDTLWYAWRSGSLLGARVDLATGKQQERPDLVLIPDLAQPGLYASPARGGVLVGVTSGPLLWCCHALPGGESLLYSPSGYLAGRFDLDPDLYTFRIDGRESTPVARVLLDRFDPKRVRAAIAGVPIIPAATPIPPEGESDF